nr:structural protein [Tolivirales sp.]
MPTTQSKTIQRAPVAQQRIVRQTQPSFKSERGGNIRVQHREYIDDVIGNSAFTIQRYEVNPGLEAVFHWLYVIAARFESYTINRLRFIYEPTSSTQTSGTVMLGIDYDASDDSPLDKISFMAMKSSVRSAPWGQVILDCSPKDIHKMAKEKYIRGAALLPNLDVKTYDVGNMYAAVQGMATTAAVGELYVEYDVTFLTPVLEEPSVQLYSLKKKTGSFNFNNQFDSPTTTSGELPVILGSRNIEFPVAGLYGIDLNATLSSDTARSVVNALTALTVDNINPAGALPVISNQIIAPSLSDAINTKDLSNYFNIFVPEPGGRVTFPGSAVAMTALTLLVSYLKKSNTL